MNSSRFGIILIATFVAGYATHFAMARFDTMTRRERNRERLEVYYRSVFRLGDDFDKDAQPFHLNFYEYMGKTRAMLPSDREDMYTLDVDVDKDRRIKGVDVFEAFVM